MAIRFPDHVRTRVARRGTTEDEIAEVLAKGLPDIARPGRRAKSLIYPFGRAWGGRTYEQKKVRVIYVLEEDDTVVVTVYVYYGSWQ